MLNLNPVPISFNPCFAGSCFATRMVRQNSSRKKRFQSLFCWKLFCNLNKAHPDVTWEECFNPCFAGSCFATRIVVTGHSDFIGFNPCFAGSCFATVIAAENFRKIIAVSILVLLEAVLQLELHAFLVNKKQKFQSLFCWKLFCNLDRSATSGSSNNVSILVLLEAGLQPEVAEWEC